MAWKLYYDGGCNLCHASKLRVEKWANRRGTPLDIELLQSADAYDKGYTEQMTLEADGQVYRAFEAWRKLMEIAPYGLSLVGKLAHVPGFSAIFRAGYNLIAHYRYRWFGTRSCPMPPRPGKS
jgi:predicted DCC family thiol-disulfide oxidoreductase YuxK